MVTSDQILTKFPFVYYLEKKKNQQKILFIGNPGVGKSTLLNAYMKDLHNSVDKDHYFKSGLSIGKGMTYKLDTRELGNHTFMDTPGLEDIRMREKAAAAITEALKFGGFYKIVFVVTLESGRIRTIDSATINLILNNAPDITHYGLIINKMSKRFYEHIKQEKETEEKLLDEFMLPIDRYKDKEEPLAIPLPLFIKKIDDLDDMDDAIAEIHGLKRFMDALPPLKINEEKVKDIPGDTTLEKIVKELEKKITELKADNERLYAQIVSDRKSYDAHFKEMFENERKRQVEELAALQQRHDEILQRERDALTLLNEKFVKISKNMDDNKKEMEQKLNDEKEENQKNKLKLEEIAKEKQRTENEFKNMAEQLRQTEERIKHLQENEGSSIMKVFNWIFGRKKTTQKK